jgi:GNAT superfamily N-acetyltransferase
MRRHSTRRSICARSPPGLPLADLETIERYYDAAPRSAARAVEHGPFTIFAGEGPWPYYARPRLGSGVHEFTADEVSATRVRQAELGLPETFEWVHETTPSLLHAARAAGLDVLEAPLMLLDRGEWRAPDAPSGVTVRMLGSDEPEPELAAAGAVAGVGFGRAGTAPGPEGRVERDAAAAVVNEATLDFRRERLRRRVTVTVVAENAMGAVAVGSHQPVGDVTELVGIATLPAVRRQGLGAAVTGALVEDALEHGAATVFLSAGSEDIARVYRRLGFRRAGTACIVG